MNTPNIKNFFILKMQTLAPRTPEKLYLINYICWRGEGKPALFENPSLSKIPPFPPGLSYIYIKGFLHPTKNQLQRVACSPFHTNGYGL